MQRLTLFVMDVDMNLSLEVHSIRNLSALKPKLLLIKGIGENV